jgi:oligopeptide/dipeptide ABC transporter ATP-binding protein
VTAPLLEVRGLTKHFRATSGMIRRRVRLVKAVEGVSFDIYPGETLGLVGESGCGKSTVGRMLLRLIDPTAGEVTMRDNGTAVNVGALRGEDLRRFRRRIQMIFQDPYSSLNPRMRVAELIGEPIRALEPGVSTDEVEERVKWIAEAVGLKREQMRRYPHAFSGGQRQRICIARALAVRPRLVICDEPVSALDVSVRAQIMNLLRDLQQEFGLTYLFIAHDLAVVENISNRIAVMYAGRIVETGPSAALFRDPQHPYTRALLAAVPVPDPSRKIEVSVQGEVAEASNLPPGCAFHPRCPFAIERCRVDVPVLEAAATEHEVACHVPAEPTLRRP